MAKMATTSPCAPRFEFVRTRIIRHAQIAKDTWQLTFEAPQMAASVLPGQFFMIRIAGLNDPLIGRALALFDMHRDAQGNPGAISLVYTVKGKFTRVLAMSVAGDEVEVWGPLGNAFSTEPVDHLILVAGGVGQTPMLTTIKASLGLETYGAPAMPIGYAKRVSLVYGARTKDYLAGVPDFQNVCSDVHLATEDGSVGVQGRVTDVLAPMLQARGDQSLRVACSGPEPMMHAVSALAAQYGVACQVSLETPMACGVGICFTCVAKVVQDDGEWDYKRTCVEGPIFDAAKICWS